MLAMLEVPDGFDPDPVLAAAAKDAGTYVGAELVDEGRRVLVRVCSPDGVVFDIACASGPLDAQRAISSARRYCQVDGTARAFAALRFAETFPDLSDEQRATLADLRAHAAANDGCDHAVRCCREHGTHSSPHIRCILR